MSVLALFAIVQVLAVAVHYSSAVRQHVANAALEARDQREPEPAAAVQPAPLSQAAPVPADMLKAQQLFAEADRNYRVGDFEMALKLIDEVGVLMPGDPSVLLRKAQILERMDQYGQAVVALEAALNVPGLPPEIRASAEKKLSELAERLGAGGAVSGSSAASTAQMEVAEAGQEDIRDAVGLQPGSTLGIIDARLLDAETGLKSLRVAVKSRPGETINIPDVQIFIYFYEETETGDVVVTDSQVKTQWLSPPIDWAADEPELLKGEYPLPESGLPGSAAANGITGRKYHGFVVAVYYKNELQDFRSDPARLVKDFPLQLSLKDR